MKLADTFRTDNKSTKNPDLWNGRISIEETAA
jgi:hypothetical protein